MTASLRSTSPCSLGGIILVGGQSSRMGANKAELMLGGLTFLEQLVETLSAACEPIVIVGRVAEPLKSKLSAQYRTLIFTQDERNDCGPLEGIRVGLKTLSADTEHAFVTAVDAPLLKPEFITALLNRIGEHVAAIPIAGSRIYGMTAIYRTSLLDQIEQQIQSGNLRVKSLAEIPGVRMVDVAELQTIDPQLDSLLNVNTPDDYEGLQVRQLT